MVDVISRYLKQDVLRYPVTTKYISSLHLLVSISQHFVVTTISS